MCGTERSNDGISRTIDLIKLNALRPKDAHEPWEAAAGIPARSKICGKEHQEEMLCTLSCQQVTCLLSSHVLQQYTVTKHAHGWPTK